jgi:rhodanese-related sulfurtransferase
VPPLTSAYSAEGGFDEVGVVELQQMLAEQQAQQQQQQQAQRAAAAAGQQQEEAREQWQLVLLDVRLAEEFCAGGWAGGCGCGCGCSAAQRLAGPAAACRLPVGRQPCAPADHDPQLLARWLRVRGSGRDSAASLPTAAGHVAGAISLPLEQLSGAVRAGQLERHRGAVVAVVGDGGTRSRQAAVRLKKVGAHGGWAGLGWAGLRCALSVALCRVEQHARGHRRCCCAAHAAQVFGFPSVLHIAGGVPEWQQQGLPLAAATVAGAST